MPENEGQEGQIPSSEQEKPKPKRKPSSTKKTPENDEEVFSARPEDEWVYPVLKHQGFKERDIKQLKKQDFEPGVVPGPIEKSAEELTEEKTLEQIREEIYKKYEIIYPIFNKEGALTSEDMILFDETWTALRDLFQQQFRYLTSDDQIHIVKRNIEELHLRKKQFEERIAKELQGRLVDNDIKHYIVLNQLIERATVPSDEKERENYKKAFVDNYTWLLDHHQRQREEALSKNDYDRAKRELTHKNNLIRMREEFENKFRGTGQGGAFRAEGRSGFKAEGEEQPTAHRPRTRNEYRSQQRRKKQTEREIETSNGNGGNGNGENTYEAINGAELVQEKIDRKKVFGEMYEIIHSEEEGIYAEESDTKFNKLAQKLYDLFVGQLEKATHPDLKSEIENDLNKVTRLLSRHEKAKLQFRKIGIDNQGHGIYTIPKIIALKEKTKQPQAKAPEAPAIPAAPREPEEIREYERFLDGIRTQARQKLLEMYGQTWKEQEKEANLARLIPALVAKILEKLQKNV